MGTNSKIEWCDHTFNPWIGCQRVSAACDFCYAESWAERYGLVQWGPGAERRRTSDENWFKPRQWNRAAEAAGVRAKVFCASLADWLDNAVPEDWRMDLLAKIRETPHLDWLLLTKRIENYARLVPWVAPPANVWLGVSVENQETADRRISLLHEIPGSVRFLSCEPLLGPLDLRHWLSRRLDWVIAGGESGPDARPMHPDWARSLRDQCKRAGVPFFFKQWGEWAYDPRVGRKEMRGHDQPHAIDECWSMIRVGKKRAGRLLDGVEHSAFPELAA